MVNGQNLQDAYWPFGRGDNTFQLDFNNSGETSFTFRQVGYDRTNASISDRYGNLLFYSNGCQVADADHQIMPHGDSLNFNLFYTDFIADCRFGYIEKQGIAILPDPGNEEGYYIIHKPFEMERTPTGQLVFSKENILYSYVDMTLNGGKGDITIKNDTVIHREYLQSAHMAAIHHANGQDWWILQPADKAGDSLYYKILLDETGVARIDSQAIGPEFLPEGLPAKAPAGGYSRFSPDGTMYAYFNLWDGLHLYDFDRETGLLSNGVDLDFGWEANGNVWLSSVEFSPDSRFIYLINTFSLYQLDTWAPDLMSSLTHIADRDTTVLTRFDHFHMMAAGPDCKIYIRSGSSTDNFSIIHNPNAKGLDCDFRQADLVLSNRTGGGNFPYFPRFRVDDPEPCIPQEGLSDSICFPLMGQVFCSEIIQDIISDWVSFYCDTENRSLEIATVSNTVSHLLRIRLHDTIREQIRIYDKFYNCNGRLVGKNEFRDGAELNTTHDSVRHFVVLEQWGDCTDLPGCPDLDNDGYDQNADCDDTNADINPEGVEICNNLDDDCDGEIDEGLTVQRYYYDADGDGFGRVDSSLVLCGLPPNFADNFDDCDDDNPLAYPGAEEIIGNGIDEDGDGADQTTSTSDQPDVALHIFPNPTQATLYLKLDANASYSYEIRSVTLELIQKGDTSGTIDVNNLAEGVYLLTVSDDSASVIGHQRVMIVR